MKRRLEHLDFRKQQSEIPALQVSIREVNEAVRAGEDEPRRWISGIATTACLDMNGVEITEAALRASANDLLTFSTILDGHDTGRAVGRVTECYYDDAIKGIRFTGFISSVENDLWTKVREGVLNKFSVSWHTMDYEYVEQPNGESKIVVHSLRLLEVSLVSVPSVPEAELTSWVERALRCAGVSAADAQVVSSEIATFEQLKFAHTPPSRRPWDSVGAIQRIRVLAGGPAKQDVDWSVYQQAFAHVSGDGSRFGDYGFPHHDVVDGHLVSSRAGLDVAVAKLKVSDLPDEDKRSVAQHLVKELRTTHGVLSTRNLPAFLVGLAA